VKAARLVDAVIVLDLDDTLYLERTYVESGLRAVGAWFEGQYGHYGLALDMIDRFRSGAREKIFDLSLQNAGIPFSPRVIDRMLRVYRQHRPTISLASDALRLFERRPPNMAIAIITDGFLDAQRRKLRALDVHRHGVALAICTDRWGRQFWKPSCRAFRHVQTFFGIDGSALVYVADNPAKDFQAPRALGWRTVQINREYRLHQIPVSSAKADREIVSLDDMDFGAQG
jgi:putative hydrolase of the HAD superfamily